MLEDFLNTPQTTKVAVSLPIRIKVNYNKTILLHHFLKVAALVFALKKIGI